MSSRSSSRPQHTYLDQTLEKKIKRIHYQIYLNTKKIE